VVTPISTRAHDEIQKGIPTTFILTNTGIATPRKVFVSDQCGMDDSPWSGEEMGGETGKGGELLGENGFIEMESHYLKLPIDGVENSLSAILFLSISSLSNKRCVFPLSFQSSFHPSIVMIHADNLGSAVRMFSVELGSLKIFSFSLDFYNPF
jgi:hypothetical protein